MNTMTKLMGLERLIMPHGVKGTTWLPADSAAPARCVIDSGVPFSQVHNRPQESDHQADIYLQQLNERNCFLKDVLAKGYAEFAIIKEQALPFLRIQAAHQMQLKCHYQ